MMYNSALLFIGETVSKARLLKLFKFVSHHAKTKVYVSMNPTLTKTLSHYLLCIDKCYKTAEILESSTSVSIDIRFLLPNDTMASWQNLREADLLIVDSYISDDEAIRGFASRILKKVPSVLLHANVDSDKTDAETDGSSLVDSPTNAYDYVALGGTFDRLHNGHKILLSVGALFANKHLTVGMTTEKMLLSKTLSELIEPLKVRTKNVVEFLNDIKPGLHYHVCPLSDPWGPPAHDPRYQALVGSPETRKGCEKINTLRGEKSFDPCVIHMINIVSNLNRDDAHEEEKVSSSTGRLRLLGTLLRPPIRPYNAKLEPIVIGLTGGIASGKSAVGKRLVSLGAHLIDCDRLGHETYEKGSTCYRRIIEAFGEEILNEDEEINRRKLGSIVFGNESQMNVLTSIVWPEIMHLARARMDEIWNNSKKSDGPCVIVMEAAVLLDAGWQTICHEIWTTFIPQEEAITRLMNRNGLSREESLKRLNSQKTNSEYLEAANVAFCSLWEVEYTFSQIKRSWSLLHQRISNGQTEIPRL